MAHTTRLPSGAAGMIPGGENTYVDPLGEPQRVHVEYEEGIPWATFLDADEEDVGVRVDTRTLAGRFTRTL